MARVNTNSTALIVPPPASAPGAALTNDIREIRPPRPIPSDWAWLGWTLMALALIALAAWLWRWWRKRRLVAPPAPVIPAHVRARQRLQAALVLLPDPREFCFRISEVLRVYLEERFTLHAPERTTEEFLFELQSTRQLLPDQKQSLGEFMERCDLVKFARHEPTEAVLRDLHDRALRLVEETQYEPLTLDAAPAGPGPRSHASPLRTS
jgi:hypothetical protein